MTSFAVLAIVKATLVSGVALLLSRLCRRARASIRHLLFALAFTALVAIPTAGLMLPALEVTVPAMGTATALRTHDMASAVPSSGAADSSGTNTPSLSRFTVPTGSATIAQVVTAVWLSGVVLFLMPVVVGLWQLRRMHKSASAWTDGQVLGQMLARTMGVHRRIDVLHHDVLTGPMTCGVLKPAIILPASTQQWDVASLRCALRHELEHVARWDFLSQCLSRIVCAAYWFHPLVWAAWRRLRLEAERACDDVVLQENDARDYASLLVAVAQREAAHKQQPLLAMAGRDDLAARVAAVLDDGRARGRVGRRQATALIVAAAMAIVGIAPITVVRAMPQTQPTATAGPFLRFETVSITRNTGFGGSSRSMVRTVEGAFTATNITTRLLLFLAYGPTPNGIREQHQIENAPAWVDSDHFDVVARPSATAPQQRPQMLQSLLAERFKLVAHRDSKEFPIYALVLSRPDGSLGPRMTPSQLDCRATPGASSPCGLSGTLGRLVGHGITIAQLIRILPRHLGGRIGLDRPLIDHTGLSGAFDFTLEWTPDPVAPEILAPSQAPPALAPYREYTRPLESNAPNFLAAWSEQLGLRFDNQVAPEPVLVIDKIEPPTEN